jgi:hypothetical protein
MTRLLARVARFAGVLMIIMVSASCGFVIGAAVSLS